MDYQDIHETNAEEVRPLFGEGEIAAYIAALWEADPRRFTIAVETVEGECFQHGEASEFTDRVGMPGKSGAGGGIVVVIPGQLAIAVCSPEPNEHGNAIAGIKSFELFTSKTGMSLF